MFWAPYKIYKPAGNPPNSGPGIPPSYNPLGLQVMRIGNTTDPVTKEITALNASDPPLPPGAKTKQKQQSHKKRKKPWSEVS